MSGDGFHVSTQELHSHAATVDGVASAVDEAADAAGTERAGGLVYGVLFDGLAQPFLNLWADHLKAVIANNAEVGHSISKAIADNADTYEGVEQATKAHVATAGSGG